MPMDLLVKPIASQRQRWLDLLQKLVDIDSGSYDTGLS